MRSVLASAVIMLALVRLADAQPEPAPEPPSQPQAEPPPPSDPPAPTTESGRGRIVFDEPPRPDPVAAKPLEQSAHGFVDTVRVGDGFRFGSYGRVIAGTDLRGGKPEAVTIVAHGPRIVEQSYLELDFSYGFETPRGVKLRPVITLAFDGTLFHDTGDFDAHPALRNMFLDAQVSSHLTAWAGSRMYRGDDIYLFDYWPLDDQNTVGGGLTYHAETSRAERTHQELDLAGHVGFNRLNKPFQFQQIEVANPEQGATTVVQLNRQRIVASVTATYSMVGAMPQDGNTKMKLHAELHELPSGTRKRDDGSFEALPADHGFLIGTELVVYGMSSNMQYRRHINLFARYASGLAAFDELAPPTSFGPDLTTGRASELSFGASGNWDFSLGNVMLGALSRRFVDADENTTDRDDGWEYAIDTRPLFRAMPDVFIGADLSYQARFPRGLNPTTQRAEDPAVVQIAPMLVYSPLGPSAYDRPQLRLVYRAAHLNEAARDQYVPDDPRHGHEWTHFLGFEAEWWFNSSTYNH